MNPNPSGATTTSARVLVVQKSNAEIPLAEALEGDHSLILAGSGSEALARLENDPEPESVAVVLCDARLADLSGVDLLARIGNLLPDAQRLLIQDGRDAEALLVAINRARIHYCLSPDASETEIRAAVTAAVARQDRRRQAQRLALAKVLEEKDRELEEAYQLVEHASQIDALTGLRNRPYMQHHFEGSLSGPAAGQDLLFLLADLDQFGPVNDIYGHTAGDRLLEEFACRLQETFHEPDLLVRWGGDQFLVVAHYHRQDGGDGVAERLRSVIADQPFDVGKEVMLGKSCSIGFAPFPFFVDAPEVMNWTRVLNFADQARLVAKRSGGNAWVGFQPREGIEPLDAAKRILSSPEQACAKGILKVSTSTGSTSLLTWE